MKAAQVLRILMITVALLVLPGIYYASCPLPFGGFLQLSIAIDDPGCTNEDCPPEPDPGCTNEDCPPEPDPGCTNEDCPPEPDPGCTNEDCPPEPDPGCTNEDCPPEPDPGCTNEDCPLPAYYADCCCYEDYDPDLADIQRLCCCKEGRKVNCRLSRVVSYTPPDHETISDISLVMGQIPNYSQGLCAPDWFIDTFRNPWWPLGEGCGWWKQLHKCGPLQ